MRFPGRIGDGPVMRVFIFLINLYSSLNPSINLTFTICRGLTRASNLTAIAAPSLPSHLPNRRENQKGGGNLD